MFIKHYAPNRCFCIKVAKSTHNYKIAVSCVQRMEVIVKIKKKKSQGEGPGGMCSKNGSYCREKEKSWGGGGGAQGRCERISEAFVEIKIKKGGGVEGWVRGGGGGGVK